MLHTVLDVVVGTLPIPSLDSKELPLMDYYALGHIHVRHDKDNIVYPSCIFPNNFKELDDLEHGAFVIHDIETNVTEFIDLKQIDVVRIAYDIKDDVDSIIIPANKIVLLKVEGRGSVRHQHFKNIQAEAVESGSILLVNTRRLKPKFELPIVGTNVDKNATFDTIREDFIKVNPSSFNDMLQPLMSALLVEKGDGERKAVFEARLIDDVLAAFEVEGKEIPSLVG
jgi:DNA repair exonuclease SbcCD nuclease subunit